MHACLPLNQPWNSVDQRANLKKGRAKLLRFMAFLGLQKLFSASMLAKTLIHFCFNFYVKHPQGTQHFDICDLGSNQLNSMKISPKDKTPLEYFSLNFFIELHNPQCLSCQIPSYTRRGNDDNSTKGKNTDDASYLILSHAFKKIALSISLEHTVRVM